MNLPNLITLGRLISVPVAVWLMLSEEFAAAFWLFMAAGFSDALDGFIAKRFGQSTTLGALLDPLADKALLVSVYVTLGAAGHLPIWLAILVVFRDILIIGGYLLAQVVTQPLHPNPLGISKLNTALQISLIAFLLARLGFGFSDFGFPGFGLTRVLEYSVGLTTVASGTAYVVRWVRLLAGTEVAK